MKVLGRIFLNSRKEGRKDVKTERRKDGGFFVSCRRTYVLNNQKGITSFFISCLNEIICQRQ